MELLLFRILNIEQMNLFFFSSKFDYNNKTDSTPQKTPVKDLDKNIANFYGITLPTTHSA